MNEHPQPQESIVEEILNTPPLEPLPENFVQQVMVQIKALSSEPIQVRFRLDFMDWAIPLFLAFFAFIVIGLIRQWPVLYGLFGGSAAPAAAVVPIHPDWLLFIGLLVLAEILLAGAVGVWFWFGQPLPTAHRS